MRKCVYDIVEMYKFIYNDTMCYLINDKEIIYSSFLKDNTPVIFHFIGPECKTCISRGLAKLSYMSRIFRFNSPIKNFSSQQLVFLTELDGYNHCAIGGGGFNCDPGMGLVRYYRFKDNPEMAEFAITVVDEFQHKGLGTLLFGLIIEYALKKNIQKFCGYVNPANRAMLGLMEKFDGSIKRNEGNLLYIEFNLIKCEHLVKDIISISPWKTDSQVDGKISR